MEYISEWFEAGLREIGMTKKQFLKLPEKEKNEVREILEEFGHY